MSLRIVFMGTPDFAVPSLAEIMAAGHDVVAVYSREPKAAGRGMALRLSPVHQFAQSAGIDVFTPKSLKGQDEQQRLRDLAPDVIVVVAYGLLLPKAVLDIPRLHCLNLHGSLLPRWRGAAPIQRAIMAGDLQTGVMVMKMEAGLDTGPVAMAEKITISGNMTALELHNQMMRLGADLLNRALSAALRGGLTFAAQSENGVTYAHKIEKAEARIDFRKPASHVHNLVRGLSPFPGAWFELDGERVKLLRTELVDVNGAPGVTIDDGLTIACGTKGIRCIHVKPSGKKEMSAPEFLRGHPVSKGTQLATL